MNWKSPVSFVSGVISSVCGGLLINVDEILSIVLTVVGIVGASCSLIISLWNIVDKVKARYKNDGKLDDEETAQTKKELEDAFHEFDEKVKKD